MRIFRPRSPNVVAAHAGQSEEAPIHRPRVLLVQGILPHYRLELFQALAERTRFEIDFAFGRAPSGSSLQSAEPPPELRVIPLRNFSLGRNGLLSFQAGLTAAINSGAYDVVIAGFNPRIISNVVACLRPDRRARFIWWGHGIGPNAGYLTARVRVCLAELGDAVIFYDQKQAERLISAGLARQKVFVAPNSIDVGMVDGLRRNTPASKRRDVLFIGRLTERKRVDVLLRAYASARPTLCRDARLVIIGDGPERAMLGDLARDLGVSDSVVFVGATYDHEVLAEYFNSAWVSICVGDVGLGAIHSLAFGLPMIIARHAHHGPEVAALRDGETAAVLDSVDVPQVVSAILALRRDHVGWTRMSQLCVEIARREYGIASMVQVFEDAILAVT